MSRTLDEWIARDAIPLTLDSQQSINAAVDTLVAALGDSVDLLGLGEPMHGGEEFLILRNRLFERLVEAHGYTTIAVESSFPKSRAVNDYVAGRGPASFDAVQDNGFSHGFGKLDANRELVEWMRQYNSDAAHCVKLRFDGFDSPTEMVGTDSPRQVLHFVLDYLDAIGAAGGCAWRDRIDALLGDDAEWENPAASFDPTKSIGLSAAAAALRIETEDLITELGLRRPELIANRDEGRYFEAAHYASMARQLLNDHAGLARASSRRIAEMLGMRDVMMAENLAYIVSRERRAYRRRTGARGKVLAFAHNSHLQRSMARWQLGAEALAWWPAGSHLDAIFGPRYAVIGAGVGISAANGIGPPEADTLEARLTGSHASGCFIPTHRGEGLAAEEINALPLRTASTKNPSYFAFSPRSVVDFDALAVLSSTTYTRGAPPLPG